MTRVVRSPAAQRDLEDIWLTIAADNAPAATRMVRLIGARIDSLAHNPRLGPRRPDIRPTARVLVVAPYLILYETQPNADDCPLEQVEIVRVVDGRRNLKTLF